MRRRKRKREPIRSVMPARNQRLILMPCVGLIVLGLLMAIGLGFLAWRHWPGFTACALSIAILWSFVFGYVYRRSTTATLGGTPHGMLPGVEGRFFAIYTPHWEIPHLLVFCGFGWRGFFPKFERWLPLATTLPQAGRHDQCKRYLVEVEGMVGEPGRFGHRGFCRREATVADLLSITELPPKGSFA